jgi:hypothetical protein
MKKWCVIQCLPPRVTWQPHRLPPLTLLRFVPHPLHFFVVCVCVLGGNGVRFLLFTSVSFVRLRFATVFGAAHFGSIEACKNAKKKIVCLTLPDGLTMWEEGV